jgi:hypothetical protein
VGKGPAPPPPEAVANYRKARRADSA